MYFIVKKFMKVKEIKTERFRKYKPYATKKIN